MSEAKVLDIYQKPVARGTAIKHLRSPAFLVRIDVVEHNCAKMIRTAKELGVKLRPNMKTHKCLPAAMLMTGGRKSGIVVSTLAEAEFFADCGFDDIFYGCVLSPDKIVRAFQLHRRLKEFSVFVDNMQIVELLNNPTVLSSVEVRSLSKKPWQILMKVDCGYHRAGVEWDSEEAVQLAKLINDSPLTEFVGIYTHCGNSYGAKIAGSAVDTVANQSADRINNLVERLAQLDIKCKVFGIGSTPTCSNPTPRMSHLTEIHPGNYVFYDIQQMSIGSCRINDIAVRVMCRVIGHYPKRNQLLIDCGFTALTKQTGAELKGSFALILDHPELRLIEMTQEVGKIECLGGSLNYAQHPIGSELYLLPWHSCATASQHPVYYVVNSDMTEVEDIWFPIRGW